MSTGLSSGKPALIGREPVLVPAPMPDCQAAKAIVCGSGRRNRPGCQQGQADWQRSGQIRPTQPECPSVSADQLFPRT